MAFVRAPNTANTFGGAAKATTHAPPRSTRNVASGGVDAASATLTGDIAVAGDATFSGDVVAATGVFPGGITAANLAAPPLLTVTPVSNSSNTEYTVGQVISRYISRTVATAVNVTDTLPSAADFVAGATAATVGGTYDLTVENATALGSSTSKGVTFSAGTGWTFLPSSGAIDIQPGHSLKMTLHLTNVSSGTEAGNVIVTAPPSYYNWPLVDFRTRMEFGDQSTSPAIKVVAFNGRIMNALGKGRLFNEGNGPLDEGNMLQGLCYGIPTTDTALTMDWVRNCLADDSFEVTILNKSSGPGFTYTLTSGNGYTVSADADPDIGPGEGRTIIVLIHNPATPVDNTNATVYFKS